MQDADLIKNNSAEYANSHTKAIAVLKKADGKTHYIDIAKAIVMHKTRVSGLLKKAEGFGLAKKVKAGVYKKIPGVLGYMPKRKKSKPDSTNTVQNLIKRIEKNQKKKKKLSVVSSLNIPARITSNIDKMANSYSALYIVENTLRELVRNVLNTKTDWWKNNIPPDIQKKVQEAIAEAPYHAAKRKDELEYTHLGQLKEIIISKKNWSDFLPNLNEKNKNSFIATVDKAIPSRNAIAHSIPLKAEDLKVVDVRFSDILKMIKN